MSSALSLLKQHFGYDSFRPQQEAIIEKIMSGNDLMVVMPTGGGKSLCFQLPALMLPGLTLVISPLIALMKDQVDALKANGIAAAFYNSTQDHLEQQQVQQDIRSGKLRLLYTAPESMAGIHNYLRETQLSLIAVDEAHCISTWGHDFRPAYTQLSHLKNTFTNTTVVALTATADRATRADIKQQLNIASAQEFVASFDRPNIFLEVRPGNQRFQQIRRYVADREGESGIIYCLSRKSCEDLASKLEAHGVRAAAYHAGMEYSFRESVQNKFIHDQIDVICATIAFGMGIDKSNVRYVIHYNMPKNVEGYYQEIGRAGRDGLDARAILFHSYADVIQLRRFAENSGNSAVQIAKLERMKQFADALTCRRRMLLSYFNEYLQEDCGSCDVCLNKPDFIEATTTAQKALSAVYRMRGQASLNLLIDVLRGASNAAVMESSFNKIKTYGAGRDISWRDWQQYIIQMINQGLLEIAFHENNHLKLTPQAEQVLFKNAPVQLAVVPKETAASQSKVTELPSEINKELYGALREMRTQIAQDSAIAPFMVFSDASLRDMAARIPLTIEEFGDITGVGEHKKEEYGNKFTAVLKNFKEERSGDFVFRSSLSRKRKPRKSTSGKTDTVMASVKKFWNGETIEQIAADRDLTSSTILGHLSKRYASHRDVDVRQFLTGVDMDYVQRNLSKYMAERSLKPFFDELEEKVDYGTLRLAFTVAETDRKRVIA